MFHSWLQKAKKPLEVICIIVGCILVIVLLVVIALTYIFNVNVPGLRGKTLWDTRARHSCWTYGSGKSISCFL